MRPSLFVAGNSSLLHLRVVVFDLDDTLYAEADYVLSGKLALAEAVALHFGRRLPDDVLATEDFIAAISRELGLPDSVKASLLWLYRLHEPKIGLRSGVAELLALLEAQGDRVCIITDGRSLTQRAKIRALGLKPHAVYISEEIGFEKPETPAFAMVTEMFPDGSYYYVGDNARKDFITPRQMGWHTIGLRHDDRAIHVGCGEGCGGTQPDVWCDDFGAIARLLALPPTESWDDYSAKPPLFQSTKD